LAEPLLAADDVVERDKDIAVPVRAVLEHLHRRQMAMTDLDAWEMRRNQRHGDAELFLLSHEMIGIVGLEGEAKELSAGGERDVALVPIEFQADHLTAFEIAFADDAPIDHRGCVRACFGAGQAEAGNIAAIREARQPALLLLPGAEAHQKFARPERIGHHHGDGGHDRARRKLAHHFRMGIGREAEPAMLRVGVAVYMARANKTTHSHTVFA
jgi:hypothetical protein